MTPKEKALELFYKYNTQVSQEFNSDSFKSAKISKECVLIAVDELINCDWFLETLEASNFYNKYWNEVKNEINKI